MRLRALLLVAGTIGCARPVVVLAPVPDERVELRRLIDSLLSAPETRHARWAALVVDPVRGDTLYSRDAGKLMLPASNQKILTAAVALDAFGPDHRFPTYLLARGAIRRDTLAGDLLVAGRGDPSISDSLRGDAMLPLRALAGAVRARGIRHVRGRVLSHGNAFPDANAGFGWQWEDFDYPYGAVVDELLFNEGFSIIRVRAGARPGDPATARTTPVHGYPPVRVLATTIARRAGPDSVARLDAVKDTVRGDVVVTGTIPAGDSAALAVTHRDPAAAFLHALRQALADSGVTVAGDSSVPVTGAADTLAVTYSPRLADILATFMKESQNQIGEMLFKAVALARTDTGSARVARRLVTARLIEWGAERDGFIIGDGSGLSRRNLVSPETIVRVLDAMRRGPHFQTFYDAFPVAGIDGTLARRMRNTTGEANVRGKTGTLGHVRALSGYATTASGRLLIYSLLANNYLVGTDYISRVQDTIAVRLTRLHDAGRVASGDQRR